MYAATVPAVNTCFMSTHALTQKGASVTFDERAFKIVHKGCCIAIGYLEDNLYWLAATGSSLNISKTSNLLTQLDVLLMNAHFGGAATSLHTWH